MYLVARGWGIQPGQFWEMTLPEWYVEFEHHARQNDPAQKLAGNLTPDVCDELMEMFD